MSSGIRTDAGFLAYAQNIKTIVTPVPATYGLTSSIVTSLGSSLDSYSSALAACEPGVRTKAGVVTKNQARKSLAATLKLVENLINGTATVTNAMKTTLGMKIPTQRHPVPAPSTAPVMQIISVDAWTVKIKLKDAEGSRRAMPQGAIGAAIFTHIGVTPPTSIGDWKFEGVSGKTVLDIVFDSTLPSGTRIFMTSMWFSSRKETGPCCPPVNTLLQGGSVQSVGTPTLALAA